MKTAKMVKIVMAGVLFAFFGQGLTMAADYSKSSDDELIKQNNGKLKPVDAADLKLEVMKRANKLEGEAKKAFLDKVKTAYDKATENFKVKDFRAYEEAVKKEFKAKIEALSEEAKAEFGFTGGGCPHHGGGEHGEHKHDDKAEAHKH